jgi:hypothetical protein
VFGYRDPVEEVAVDHGLLAGGQAADRGAANVGDGAFVEVLVDGRPRRTVRDLRTSISKTSVARCLTGSVMRGSGSGRRSMRACFVLSGGCRRRRACLEVLREGGYGGFATIEQDRVPGCGEPLLDLRASVEALMRLARAGK